MLVDLLCERLDTFAHRFHRNGELGVLVHQLDEPGALFGSELCPFLAGPRQVFPMLGIGVGVGFVAIRLTRLGQQDQGCGVGGLQAEREIEQDEWIDVEMDQARSVQGDPCSDEEGLPDQKSRRSKKPREGLGLEGKPIIPKQRCQVGMGREKAQVMRFRWGRR